MKKLSRREFVGLIAAGAASVAGVTWVETRSTGGLGDGSSAPRTVSGSFFSRYRRRHVGYSVGYPAGHGTGSHLPLIVFLHGFRGTHEHCLAGYSPDEAVSVAPNGHAVKPMAIVTVDGGNGYWHPHPDDDPMGMVIHELIPMLQRRGLGAAPMRIGVMGISMGGYGALAMAEHYPHLFSAVAAISPAIFATFDWVHYVNPGAYSGPSEFAQYNAITHARRLQSIPVRVASGRNDPFHPWVQQFVERLSSNDVVLFPPGQHDGAFFHSQIEPSISFLANHLTRHR